MNAEHALQFRELGSDETQQGVCCNLSATGIMFTTEQAVPQGAELEVNITPQYSVVSPFDAVVKVLRSQPSEAASQYTVAGKITTIQ
jgi:hypothetical protein